MVADAFAYCNNSPVMQKDDGGELGHIAVGAIIGGVLGAGLEVASQIIGGKSSIDWVSVGIEAANGALTGALVAAGLPPSTTVAGKALINGATAMSHTFHQGGNAIEAAASGFRAADISLGVGLGTNVAAPKVANYAAKSSGTIGKVARWAVKKLEKKAPTLIKKGFNYLMYGATRIPRFGGRILWNWKGHK